MKVHRKRTLTAIAAVGALIGAALIILPAQATPPSGVTTTPIATGRFDAIDTQIKTGAWKAKIKTKGASDLHVLQNTIAPGGTFGWHSHPGPSLVIVKSGTATFYKADDPACAPHVVPTGSGFVDNGKTSTSSAPRGASISSPSSSPSSRQVSRVGSTSRRLPPALPWSTAERTPEGEPPPSGSSGRIGRAPVVAGAGDRTRRAWNARDLTAAPPPVRLSATSGRIGDACPGRAPSAPVDRAQTPASSWRS